MPDAVRIYLDGKNMYLDSGKGWEKMADLPPELQMMGMMQQIQQIQQMLEIAVLSGVTINYSETTDQYKIGFSVDGKKMLGQMAGHFLGGGSPMMDMGKMQKEIEKIMKACNIAYVIEVDKQSMLPVQSAMNMKVDDKGNVFNLKMHFEGKITETNKEIKLPPDIPKV